MKQPVVWCGMLLLLASCAEPDSEKSAPPNQFIGNYSGTTNGNGKALFQVNCAVCHNLFKDATGPALGGGILQRWGFDTAKLIAYIRNPAKIIKQEGKNSHIGRLHTRFGNVNQLPYGSLTVTDVKTLIAYLENSSGNY